MSAKRRTEEAPESFIEANPFAPEVTQVNPEFKLADLLEAYKTKALENDKRKVGINERISKAKQNIARIEAMIESLTGKSQQESGQAWVREVVLPLVTEIQKVFPNAVLDINAMQTGAVVLTLCKKGITATARMKNMDCKSLTLVPQENGIGVRDYSQSTNEYPQGSIGAIQGLNHSVISVDAENPVSFLVDWLLK